MRQTVAEPVVEFAGGPEIAELVATRSELKRVQAENAELKDRLARRQADFENYRKRGESERTETYNRVVADIATKLLPVWTILSEHWKPKRQWKPMSRTSFDIF